MQLNLRPSWDEYAIILAEAARTRSEDPYVKVGACILRADHSVAAVGYNGPPSGVQIDWSDRDGRRPRIIHAEANTLRYIRPGEGVLLATTLLPCLECLKLAASYGIRDVLYKENIENSDVYDTSLIDKIAKEFKVTLRQL